MLLLIKSDYTLIGYLILFISVLSGVYGVMLAIIQHNLKKLLAYHSIENIGIIGIGIGLGSIGMGTNNIALIVLGFTGAILHTLNHSLFKSLLFYAAGNVYQSAHTMDIEELGGLGKQMPRTAFLFLIAAIAICGLPPFNGFVSEFLIYNGMLAGFQHANLSFLSLLVFSLFSLVLIGGLAILCFTKAFGTVFLGTSRHLAHYSEPSEAPLGKLIPMFVIMALMTFIGIFPVFFIHIISEPVSLFIPVFDHHSKVFPLSVSLLMISQCALGFIIFSSVIFFIRKRITAHHPIMIGPTWGCGYGTPNNRMQYSASSFVRAYRKLAEPVLTIHSRKREIKGIFPKEAVHETHPYDKAEALFIDYPLKQLKHFFNKFTFLQNGNPQFYILYGVLFITIVIVTPVLFAALITLIHFFNQI
jgi:NADH:ubiquinone oxidoreductase subunit 5 (subunit L)/multisubunit Na+/H+ antiporter MnhA subunit